MSDLDELIVVALKLSDARLGALVELAISLSREVRVDVAAGSDLATPEFVDELSEHLLVHHATTDRKLTKKAFEFAFRAACRARRWAAELDANPNNPGADVTADGVAFSLKTEGAKDMARDKITISKLMEARWIRECRTGEQFRAAVADHVVDHLDEYERILVLRAFESDTEFTYDLMEIPVDLLSRVADLSAEDFRPRTKSGGSSARVRVDGARAFTLGLDGSVEKVTVNGLVTSLCVRHGTWVVDKDPD